jgi:transcriptional regulator with XRE-family HTH domain
MPMTPLDRKILLLQKGVTLDDIAQKLRRKRSISTISRVISGKQAREVEEIQRVAAGLAGVPLEQMFGT